MDIRIDSCFRITFANLLEYVPCAQLLNESNPALLEKLDIFVSVRGIHQVYPSTK